eukprot:Polyplicarium_translucidae@DN115_c0_g1_i2.p1
MLYQDIVLSWHSAPAPRGCWVPLCFEIVRGGFLAVSNDQFWQRMRNVSEGVSGVNMMHMELAVLSWHGDRARVPANSLGRQAAGAALFFMPVSRAYLLALFLAVKLFVRIRCVRTVARTKCVSYPTPFSLW